MACGKRGYRSRGRHMLTDLSTLLVRYLKRQGVTGPLAKIDSHAQVTKVSRKKRKLFHKPWITRGIFFSIRHKQKMYKSIFVNGNEFQKKYINNILMN